MHATTSTVAEGIRLIDTDMAGERQLNAVYLIASAEPCLIEAGPGADLPRILEALSQAGLGPDDLAHIAVTHIHMDHAGGAGALLDAFPRARLWVHERGAPHLADPTRLIASTARTYGEARMLRLYGRTLPCPADRLRVVNDGDTIPLGDRTLSVLHTPGHASHHIALVDDATGAAFCGEALGSFLPWGPAYRPALPPPEVDLRAAATTVDRLEAAHPSTLLASHFGAMPDPARTFARVREDLEAWSEPVERLIRADPDVEHEIVGAAVREHAVRAFASDAGRELAGEEARYDALGSIAMNAQGLARYWRRRLLEEAADQDN